MSDNGLPGKPGVPVSDEIRAEIKAAAKAICSYPSGPNAANSCCSGIGRCEMKAAIAEITRLRAELTTARKDAQEEAARRLEELHRNHKYKPETGEGSEHDTGYYRAIAEGVAHIRALKGEGNE
jgi:hypothetical protein